MSPSEFDLRAALREGEGEIPAVHRVIAQAQRRQRERRQRIRSVAVGVSVAAVMVGGFTALALNRPVENAGGADGAAYAPADAGSGTERAPQVTSRPESSTTAGSLPAVGHGVADAGCPATLPDLARGYSTTGRLFAADSSTFTSVTVCRYASGRTATADAATVLDGEAGRQFANQLEAGAREARDCLTPGPYAYAVLARDASGHDDVVVAMGGCRNYDVTNGAVDRYVDIEAFDGLFDATNSPSPKHGSPLK